MASIAIVVFIVTWGAARPVDNFKCPNDYASVDEYIRGIAEWASGELKKSPDMTKEDLLDERNRLFREHNCEPSQWPSLSE